ncbi:MAG TPA: hypothetical protein VND64_12210, partial [Pirellulales bacterium]|nr:hypothetical protein [Pirellulales bacterium]
MNDASYGTRPVVERLREFVGWDKLAFGGAPAQWVSRPTIVGQWWAGARSAVLSHPFLGWSRGLFKRLTVLDIRATIGRFSRLRKGFFMATVLRNVE